MTKYRFDLEKLLENLKETKEFTWPTALFAIFGLSNKWFASCAAMVDFSCKGKGYTGPDLLVLLAASVLFGLIIWGAIIALRVAYMQLMNKYITRGERQ